MARFLALLELLLVSLFLDVQVLCDSRPGAIYLRSFRPCYRTRYLEMRRSVL